SQGRDSRVGSLTSSQRGRFISFSTWQALVVTEPAPAHHSTEKSQGSLTTYRLTEMLSWRYRLRRGKEPHQCDTGQQDLGNFGPPPTLCRAAQGQDMQQPYHTPKRGA
uniref:Uncharacterized protein n=1 Tax=Chelonoidis abingdonii TaxID=106734 RepID=A0A8C0QR37_CHEAB